MTYRITCDACYEQIGEDAANYIGMTRVSVHNRMLGHMTGQRGKVTKNPLWRHDLDAHSGVHQTYSTVITTSEKRLVRLCCMEALQIEKKTELCPSMPGWKEGEVEW